ncbi:M15 family metallopeptidase [Candidatus Saccharibacteria bacterium]|nr:M15 family metallopeptidase [Candidatus Saccharibacteria bacterium]
MSVHSLRIVKKLAEKLSVFLLLVAVVGMIVWWRRDDNTQAVLKNTNIPTDTQKTAQSTKPISSPGFNKKQYSVNDPASIWVVVNKGRILPADYVPANLVENMNLRSEPATALKSLINGAAKDGLKLILVSGYRSYTSQKSVYDSYVATQGQAAADTFSARPGHSEHQTGLAADVGASSGKCQLDKCFGDTPEGQWLAANAYSYGFIIRYPQDKTSLTGYDFEPWHIRYIGIDLANEVNKTGQTLEQFFGLPAYSNYPADYYQLKTGS